MRRTKMDGDLNAWWMVLSALLVVLALPTGSGRPNRQARRVE
jgi:hypothetical protein